MGTIIVNNTCEAGVTITWRPNGPGGAPIDGLYVQIDTPTGLLSPLPTAGTIDAAPSATYTVEFVMTGGADDGTDLVWGSHPVTTPALLTNCDVAPPTTVAGANTTAPPAPVPSTTAPQGSGVTLPCPLPTFRPGIGWECPPVSVNLPCALPVFTPATGWYCSAPSTTTAIDLTTAEVGVPPVASQLPATGLDGTAVLGLSGGLCIALAAVCAIVARRPRVTS